MKRQKGKKKYNTCVRKELLLRNYNYTFDA